MPPVYKVNYLQINPGWQINDSNSDVSASFYQSPHHILLFLVQSKWKVLTNQEHVIYAIYHYS